MPFSPERTKEIQSRIEAHLQSGRANDWEVSFLTNMAERFQRSGTETRLSKAQYASLHKVLKLEREAPTQTQAAIGGGPSKPAPKRNSRSYQTSARTMNVTRANTSPRRAVRKVQRQILVPLIVAVALFAVVGSFFDPTSSRSTSHTPSATSTSQTPTAAYVYVTGTRVNQRAGPSTSDAVMGVLAEGTRIVWLREEGQWTQIRSNDFERVACACRPGTEGTDRCNFGRLCGSLRVDGQDVGRILIDEGLAVPYRCGRTSCPPRPQAWCR